MFRLISISTIVIAGLVHLIITPNHFSHAPAHGILFGMMGVGQIAWAYAFWQYTSSYRLYYVGLALSGGVIVLWSLTQFVSVPFALEAEPIDWATLLSKVSELIGFIALIIVAGKGQISAYKKRTRRKLIGVVLLVALIAGIGFWGMGHLAEKILPGLGHMGDHGNVHDHADEEIQSVNQDPEEHDHEEHDHQ